MTKSPTFLRALATTPEAPVEEVTAASIRAAHAAWRREAGDGRANEQLVLWGKYLARLFRNDYDRFEAIVQRVPPIPGSGGKSWEERLPAWTMPKLCQEALARGNSAAAAEAK